MAGQDTVDAVLGIRLYQGRLQLDLTDPDTVITRTDGVTASFIKELLRRAALFGRRIRRPGYRRHTA